MIERNIDYLQFTASMHEWEFTREEFKPCKGIPYYSRGYLAHNGTRFYFGNKRGANCFVVLAGEQCQYLRDCGQSNSDMIGWAFANGAKVSRIDLAVTEWIEDDLFTMEDVETWFKSSLIISPLIVGGLKTISSIQELTETQKETIYIGDMSQRGKRGIFRAYDKGIEIGLCKEVISRIELELKREKAHAVAVRIEKSGDIAGNFRTYFDVKHPTFERIMDSPVMEAIRGKAKPKTMQDNDNDKRWKWLLNQVAPAMKEAIAVDKNLGLGNARMFEFMSLAGIVGDATEFAQRWAEYKLSKLKTQKFDLLD